MCIHEADDNDGKVPTRQENLCRPYRKNWCPIQVDSGGNDANTSRRIAMVVVVVPVVVVVGPRACCRDRGGECRRRGRRRAGRPGGRPGGRQGGRPWLSGGAGAGAGLVT